MNFKVDPAKGQFDGRSLRRFSRLTGSFANFDKCSVDLKKVLSDAVLIYGSTSFVCALHIN